MVNAFATAGGHLYVTDGLVATLRNDEGELAVVVGHETGHLIDRLLTEKDANQEAVREYTELEL